MKTIRVTEIKNYRGGKLMVPEFDINGEVLQEPVLDRNGKPIEDAQGNQLMQPVTTKPANILTVLDYLVMDFPRNLFTMKHITECGRLHNKVAEAREKNAESIDLEDSQYEWLVGVLKNDKIGIPMFGMNVTSILESLGATI